MRPRLRIEPHDEARGVWPVVDVSGPVAVEVDAFTRLWRAEAFVIAEGERDDANG